MSVESVPRFPHDGSMTVAQLVASAPLREARVLGGRAGLNNSVRDVMIGSARDRPAADPAARQVLLILDASEQRFDTYLVDIALRAAEQSGASGLLLVAPASPPALAAVRLADKFRLPLIIHPGRDPLVITDELRRLVRTPDIVRSDALLQAVEGLTRLPQSAGITEALDSLSGHLDGRMSLVGPGGTVLAGDDLAPDVADRLGEQPTSSRAGPEVSIIQPLHLAPRERATFWLICQLVTPAAHRELLVAETLSIASWYVATRLVADRLQRERDARFRLGVLNAIMATADRPDPALLEQLGVLGWQVEGWCTGVHITAAGETDALTVLTRTDELARLLEASGISGAIIERPDGWSLWLVDATEPQAKASVDLTDRLRGVADRFLGRSNRSELHVGVGNPHHGIAGVKESLAEAHEAATIARASGERLAVRHIDEMGLRRILLGWYTSESFAELASTLLGPVLEVDRAGELLQTLEAYLDCESSATDAATQLTVHRNTVINRIERLRELLTVDLDDPDERLAVQLACRVIKLQQAGHHQMT